MKQRVVGVLAVVAGVLMLFTANAFAQQSQSTNYSVDEVFFGSGGELDACSTNYCSKQSAGDLANGETSSTNYTAEAGFNTNREEYLEFTVNASNTDLGYLGQTYSSTTTGTFSVKAYLAHGYVIINAGDPPKTTTVAPHTLNPLASPTASSVGTEQFGINLVANTSPATFGANRTQVPDSSFSFGEPSTGYNTANLFKYVKGDTIAESTRSSGQTNFTVSYLFNINAVTQAGTYTFNHDMVALATY
jgi:hypothetical protein